MASELINYLASGSTAQPSGSTAQLHGSTACRHGSTAPTVVPRPQSSSTVYLAQALSLSTEVDAEVIFDFRIQCGSTAYLKR